MTIIGAPARDEEPIVETRAGAGARSLPPEEPELPPAAEAEVESLAPSPVAGGAAATTEDRPAPEQEPPRHVRVLPAAEELPQVDPWEEGFDSTRDGGRGDEPALAEDEAPPGFRLR